LPHKTATTTTVKAKVTKKGKIKVSGTLFPPHGGGIMQIALLKKKWAASTGQEGECPDRA
jgi:hypothetical protein